MICVTHGILTAGTHCPMCDSEYRPRDLVAEIWNTSYPERRPWDQIGAEAQLEWRRVFAIYESLKAQA
jgi:hypothetical protein